MTADFDHTRQSLDPVRSGGGETTSPDLPRSDAPEILPPGTLVGPYVIGSTLGAGAMGVVYAAFDPRLDRTIAIKMVRADPGEASKGAPRLLREAQALAMLSHPNVVPVFDVGEHAGGVFLAMELVAGHDLRHWLDQQPRPWREVLDLFVQAGRGLAAAHAAGIVHRDFKPDNVMVDAHGRARVTDFGLARGEAEAQESIGSIEQATSLNATLTRTGSVVGTPSYMSPEQHVGSPVDGRADQYAFCVSLYEAIYGERPFAGRDLQDLANHKWGEAFASDVARQMRRAIPAELHAVIVRGLKRRVDQRFADMNDLVAAIEQVTRTRRSVRPTAFILGGLALTGTAIAVATIDRARCPDPSAQLQGVWDDARAEEIGDAFERSKTAAAGAWPQLRADLDAYAEAWTAAHGELCTAAADRGDGPELDAGMLCLRQRRARLSAIAAVLEEGTRASVHSAAELVGSLEPPEACRDALARPDPPQLVRTRAVLQERLDTAGVQRDAGQYGVARQAAVEIQGEATAAGLEDLALDAELMAAVANARLGRHDEAEAGYLAVFWRARAAGLDALALEAASRQVFLLSSLVDRPREGEVWQRHAEAMLDRLGDGETLRRAKLLENAAGLYEDSEDDSRAEDMLRRALRIRLELQPATNASVATTRNNLALRLADREAFEEALAMHTQNYRTRVAHLGPTHPDVAQTLVNEARVLIDLERTGDALARLDEAEPIVHATLGPNHPMAEAIWMMRGAAHLRAGQNHVARPYLILAIAMGTLRLGPDNPNVAQRWNALGVSYMQEREWAPACETLGRAIALFANLGDGAELGLAGTLSNASMAELARGNAERAEHLAEQAYVGFARRRRAGHRDLSIVLTHRAHAALANGDLTRARKDTAAAAKILVGGIAGAARSASIQALQARIDWLDRGVTPAIVSRLRDAHDQLARLDPQSTEGVIVGRWLAEPDAIRTESALDDALGRARARDAHSRSSFTRR